MKKEYVIGGLRFNDSLHKKLEVEFDHSIGLKEYGYKQVHRTRFCMFLTDEDVVVLKLKYGDEIDITTPDEFIMQLRLRYESLKKYREPLSSGD